MNKIDKLLARLMKNKEKRLKLPISEDIKKVIIRYYLEHDINYLENLFVKTVKFLENLKLPKSHMKRSYE